MKLPNYFTVACLVAAAAVLMLGVPAFNAHDTDRDIQATTAVDENALFGVSADEPVTIYGDEETTLLRVTNQFAGDLDTVEATVETVSVEHDDEHLDVQIERTPDGLTLANTGDITVTASGYKSTTATVTVTIMAAGNGEFTTLTRTIEIVYWAD